MKRHEFDAHRYLSNLPNTLHESVLLANDKADSGRYIVATTPAGEVLVLPHFSATMRKDLEWVYDTDNGYVFKAKEA